MFFCFCIAAGIFYQTNSLVTTLVRTDYTPANLVVLISWPFSWVKAQTRGCRASHGALPLSSGGAKESICVFLVMEQHFLMHVELIFSYARSSLNVDFFESGF